MPLKLGKKPARPNAITFKLRSYLPQKLAVPADFGYETVIPSHSWNMLGNDQYGDCVWAGAAHEHMLTLRASHPRTPILQPTSDEVLGDYSRATGFRASDPSTDNGTDMEEAAAYRRKTGVLLGGKRHKITAYLAVTPDQLALASYTLGAVGVGIRFPQSAMDQFNAGQPWDAVSGSPIEGGHYVPLVARRNGLYYVVTWGQLQPVTEAFIQEYCDEAVAYVITDFLNAKHRTPNLSLDLSALKADLASL